MAGMVLEQHPERARLFMAWREMAWPIGWDPFDVLGLGVVPVVVLLDEAGIVRAVDPSRDDLAWLGRWVREEPVDAGDHVDPRVPDPIDSERSPLETARALALWGGEERLDEAVRSAEQAVEEAQGTRRGDAHFAAGVVYRMRYDSARRQTGDFARAVRHWERALAEDPNDYVRRRRLQQYGPRSAKPYPFYDWVPRAQAGIASRGEVPPPVGPLTRSEMAEPTGEMGEVTSGTDPDPQGRIHRDAGELVRVETVAVPGRVPSGETVRVHLEFRPEADAHWSNEVDPLEVWVEVPEGWGAEGRSFTSPVPGEAVSNEPRLIDFELRAPPDVTGRFEVSAYALYYVCQDRDGVCLYRRQDVTVPVEVTGTGGVDVWD